MEPANVSEVRSLEKAIEGLNPERLYADKGYASTENRRILKARKIKDGIMHKASRGSKLRHWQKVFNRLVSKSRFIIEQAFGTLKRRFNLARAAYIITAKVKSQMIIKAIAFNLLKAANMMA